MTWTWKDVWTRLSAEPAGTRLRLPRAQVEHPLDGGLERGVELPVGQRADFRSAQGLCVQDFGSHYEAYVASGQAEAVPGDAGAAAGALFALLLAGTREATLVGALLGAALRRRTQ